MTASQVFSPQTPYRQWKEKQASLFPEFCQRMVCEFISKHEFAEADRYASSMGNEKDPSRLLYRCMVSYACHQWLKTQAAGTPSPERLLSLTEAKEGFEYLSGLEFPAEQRATCRIYVLQILALLGDYPAVVEMQQHLYAEAIAKLEQYPEGQTKQMQQIALSINYYQMLHANLPDDYPCKRELLQNGFSGLMKLPDTRQACGQLLREMPQAAETLQEYMEQCDLLLPCLQ